MFSTYSNEILRLQAELEAAHNDIELLRNYALDQQKEIEELKAKLSFYLPYNTATKEVF